MAFQNTCQGHRFGDLGLADGIGGLGAYEGSELQPPWFFLHFLKSLQLRGLCTSDIMSGPRISKARLIIQNTPCTRPLLSLLPSS